MFFKAANDASRVDQDVETFDRSECGSDRGGLCDVEASFEAQGVDGSARVGESFGDGGTDAAGTAGDEDSFVVEVVHDS